MHEIAFPPTFQLDNIHKRLGFKPQNLSARTILLSSHEHLHSTDDMETPSFVERQSSDRNGKQHYSPWPIHDSFFSFPSVQPSDPNDLQNAPLPVYSLGRPNQPPILMMGNGLPNPYDGQYHPDGVETPTRGSKKVEIYTPCQSRPSNHSSDAQPITPESLPNAAHGIIIGPIDTKAYAHIDGEELAQAEIEYDPTSPASIYSPYTPPTNLTLTYVDSVYDTTSSGRSFLSGSQKKYSPHFLLEDRTSCSHANNCPPAHHTGDVIHPDTNDSSVYHSHSPTSIGALRHLRQPFDFGQFIGYNENSSPVSHPRFERPNASLATSEAGDENESTVSTPWSDITYPDAEMEEQMTFAQRHTQAFSYSSASGSLTDSDTSQAELQRTKRDQLLVEMRRNGLSYREIKERGGFAEAESTLRGKFRMLTKCKWERVRRPEWTERDIELLHAAVARFARQRPTKVTKQNQRLPWKKVSEWIKMNGGSYLFAPATCARKWESLHGEFVYHA